MNEKTKVHLSAFELELVNNTEWISTKQKIIEKVEGLFGELHNGYKSILELEKNHIPAILQKPGGKISKGDNYLGLPYLILDYPAFFSKENIFAVRTLFWWGNFFSISLHLSGKTCNNSKKISSWLEYFSRNQFFICVNETEWHHHFEPSNYIQIEGANQIVINDIANKNFFKVSKKIVLSDWNYVPEFLEDSFRKIVTFITINFPNDEIILSPGPPRAGFDL